ncbi:MAG: site-2 protease family protein [Gemmatimonadaceae bacterium]
MERLLIVLPVLLISVIAHEYAHGYAALRQGDPTAYQLGRLTWNPIKHIDPFMTLILPAVMALGNGPILGGAKPVPVNPGNYRNYRRGDIIVSLAGVATNLVIAVVLVPLIFAIGALGNASPSLVPALSVLQAMLVNGVLVNLVLVAFNLLPIPPLDGSHVVKHLLPPALALRYQQIGRFGILILIALLYFGRDILFAWMRPAYALFAMLLVPGREFLLPSRWMPWVV